MKPCFNIREKVGVHKENEKLTRIVERFLGFFTPSATLLRAMEMGLISELRVAPLMLDLGCGNGQFSVSVFKEVGVGIDVSSKAIKASKGLGLYTNLIVCDARRLPFSDNVFTTVFSNCTLEHIPEVEKAIQEVGRVLKNNGSFIFTVPSEYFSQFFFFPFKNYIDWRNKSLFHINLFKFKEWQKMLKTHGLYINTSRLYMSPTAVRLWDFLEGCFNTRIYRIGFLCLLRDKVLKRFFVHFLVRVLQKELAIVKSERLTIGGERLFIAKKRIFI